MLSLPPELESAIAIALRTLPPSQWQAAARHLSQRYRQADDEKRKSNNQARKQPTTDNRQSATGKDHVSRITYHNTTTFRTQDALGYAALVLPAAYAQLWGALRATALRLPASFQPTTLLDLGSGPGTALWAAVEHFPTLTTLDAYEREPAFIALGKTLAQSSPNPALQQTHWRQITLTGPLPNDASPVLDSKLRIQDSKFDVVVIAHALNEMPPTTRDALVLSAWDRCSGLLLIVEPGTSAAFPIVLRARDLLLSQGAHIIAPCAHNLPCPLPASDPRDWCHFPQRLQRPHFQRIAKEATAGWEESKYSYAALARFPAASPIYARLIHQPQQTKIGVDLTVSADDATIHHPHIPKRHPSYKVATRLDWGDALSSPLEP